MKREPRWTAVRYGWGFQKTGDPGTDVLANMMADYEKYIGELQDQIDDLNHKVNKDHWYVEL